MGRARAARAARSERLFLAEAAAPLASERLLLGERPERVGEPRLEPADALDERVAARALAAHEHRVRLLRARGPARDEPRDVRTVARVDDGELGALRLDERGRYT